MLGVIRGVTTVVPNLADIEAAYAKHLDYRFVERGVVSSETAQSWGAPHAAGLPYLIMQPESGEAVFLRFIEEPAAASYKGLTTYGWGSTEFTVQNTDELAEKLTHSDFRIFGPPKNLEGFETIRAMQVAGPAGECLYLTDVGVNGGVMLAKAESFVGRVFIVILCGPDIEALRQFFITEFSLEATEAKPIRNSAISTANGLPSAERHPLALVRLPDGTAIELDGLPPSCQPRDIQQGSLPIGMASVTFEVDKIPDMKLAGPPVLSQLPPYKGQKVATIVAPGGALIEMVEKPS